MIRTQVQLTDMQYNAIKELARQKNTSAASVIRSAIDKYLVSGQPGRQALYENALKVAGKYKSGASDISTHHDKYLEEAFS